VSSSSSILELGRTAFFPNKAAMLRNGLSATKRGFQYWTINSWHEDGDVALSADAPEGPDLWFEEKVMKNSL
jgi:hypothetical protein